MDTFSHALWGGGLFGYRGYFGIALLFGAFPDLISFGLLILVRIVDGTFTYGPPPLESIPPWLFFSYRFAHSFLIAFTVIGIVSLWKKHIAFAMLGWPFHICLDFPFHTLEYFPTKLFWPISDFAIDGISWGTPWIWYPNLAGIVILFAWRWYLKKVSNRNYLHL